MMSRLVLVLALLFLGGLPASVWADYRVALLIDNRQHSKESSKPPVRDMKVLADSLQKHQGFRCEILRNLEEKELKQAIQRFAESTPVRSTALVFFAGSVSQGMVNGQPTASLLSIGSKNGRGYPLLSTFEDLETRGGSERNLVVLDCPDPVTQKFQLPEGCFFANARAKTLETKQDLIASINENGKSVQSRLANDFSIEGQGSQAVASPEEFTPGNRIGDEWVNRRGMVFCWCPPGRFVAGSPEAEPGRYPDEVVKDVSIAEGFWISKYEITHGQWKGNRHRECLGSDKLHPINKASQSKDTKAREIGPLNKAEWQAGRLPQDWEYALPTEEQWEYAARAGTTTPYYFGDDSARLPLHANFSDKSHYDTASVYSNSADRTLNDGHPGLAKVGSFKPNAWGLHDISGNVAEWCDNAVVRGGSWLSVPNSCRSAYRDKRGDRDQENYIGSRFVIRKRRDKKK